MSLGRLVLRAMGTVVSLRTAQPIPAAAADAVRGGFDVLEERFSLRRPTSEGSLVAARAVALCDASPEFRAVYDLAVSWRTRTYGAFSPHRPDGVLDLSVLVRAMALTDAAAALARHGVRDWCLNAGGTAIASGEQTDGSPWVVGILDPGDRATLLRRFAARPDRPAVATVGTTGPNGRTGGGCAGRPPGPPGTNATFRQVTVRAGDVVTAAVLATAIVAGGPALFEVAQELAPIDVLACGADGRTHASSAFASPSVT